LFVLAPVSVANNSVVGRSVYEDDSGLGASGFQDGNSSLKRCVLSHFYVVAICG
jgi:hypothetical protein